MWRTVHMTVVRDHIFAVDRKQFQFVVICVHVTTVYVFLNYDHIQFK